MFGLHTRRWTTTTCSKGSRTRSNIEVEEPRALGIRAVMTPALSLTLSVKDGASPPDRIASRTRDDPRRLGAPAETVPPTIASEGANERRIALAPARAFVVGLSLQCAVGNASRRRTIAGWHTHLAETVDEEAYCSRAASACARVDWLEEAGWMGTPHTGSPTACTSTARMRAARPRGRRRLPLPDLERRRSPRASARRASWRRRAARWGSEVDGSASNDSFESDGGGAPRGDGQPPPMYGSASPSPHRERATLGDSRAAARCLGALRRSGRYAPPRHAGGPRAVHAGPSCGSRGRTTRCAGATSCAGRTGRTGHGGGRVGADRTTACPPGSTCARWSRAHSAAAAEVRPEAENV